MAVIIGGGTQVGGFTGVVSANWSMEPSVNRLWEVGSFTPYDSIIEVRQTVSVTCYGGGGPTLSLSPSDSCSDSSAVITVTIAPATCNGGVSNVADTFFVESYSYSKGEVTGCGQETYNMFKVTSEPVPTATLQGISTGQYAGNVSSFGISIGVPDATGESGNVSAGSPGLGEANTTYYGVVTSIGGGTGKEDGKKGTANAQIPHTPVWV